MGLPEIHSRITECTLCPRLRRHCESVAKIRKKSYADEKYWGKPVTGFGDPAARLVLIGLAPAAHGANRTGRIFTGDQSGKWLYRALHKAGFANQPSWERRDDGLKLKDAYVSCVVKCAPPDNKPTPAEQKKCATRHLAAELKALSKAEGFVVLGQIGLQGLWSLLGRGEPRPKFTHLGRAKLPDGRWVLMSYHPSQQNTFTGRLTGPMFDQVFTAANRLLRKPAPSQAPKES